MRAMLETDGLWNDLYSGVSAFVRRRVRNRADAEDVVQSLFLRLHRNLGSLRDGGRVHAWIYGAARNAIIDHYRARGRAKETPVGSWEDLEPEVKGVFEPEQKALQELATCLRPLMRRLAPSDRQALELVEIDGLSQVAASRRLEISVSGMKSRVQRARRRLRSAVEACCRVEPGSRGGIRGFAGCPSTGCAEARASVCEPSPI
jgi:RNA polymerase sigma-70 factor (ECF subfamily)